MRRVGLRRAARGRVPVALLLAVGLVIGAACDTIDGEASPSPSESVTAPVDGQAPTRVPAGPPTVAVVLAPVDTHHPPELVVQRQRLQSLADDVTATGEAEDMQVLVPIGDATAADVIAAQVELGVDLVCAVGPEVRQALLAAALAYRGTRFCLLTDEDVVSAPNLLALQLRVHEQAFVAGFAVGLPVSQATPAAILGEADSAVRYRRPFAAGMRLARAVEGTIAMSIATSEAQAAEQARQRYDAGVLPLWTRAGRAERGVLAVAEEEQRIVVGSAAWLRPDPEAGEVAPPWVLLYLGEDLAVPVARAIDHWNAGWVGGTVSLGFAEEALVIEGGGSTEWGRLESRILATRDAIADGSIAVPVQ